MKNKNCTTNKEPEYEEWDQETLRCIAEGMVETAFKTVFRLFDNKQNNQEEMDVNTNKENKHGDIRNNRKNSI